MSDHALSWGVDCENCAQLLDRLYAEWSAGHKAATEEAKAYMQDLYADLLHPEFGTEWREPDGVIYKAVEAARQERPNLGNMAPVISFLREVKTSGNAAMYLEAEADQILGEVFGIEDE